MIGCLLAAGRTNEFGEKNNAVSVSFEGRIVELLENRAIVAVEKGDFTGRVLVDLSMNESETFQVGDKIKVEYEGQVRESDPAQINTLSVKGMD
ncbi:DUF3221 domain-containing protein [Bacillus haikouensis]|nr:DUF3221 domain-containing protein [Bacillus haikouensis]